MTGQLASLTPLPPDTNCRWGLMVPRSYVNAVVTKRHTDATWNRIWIMQSIVSKLTELWSILGMPRVITGIWRSRRNPEAHTGTWTLTVTLRTKIFSFKVIDWPVWCIHLWSFLYPTSRTVEEGEWFLQCIHRNTQRAWQPCFLDTRRWKGKPQGSLY